MPSFAFMGWPQATNVPVGDTDNGTWQQITTLQSVSSGEHWITPFGIPFKFGEAGDGFTFNVTTAASTQLVGRYPNNSSGDYIPIGTEQFNFRRDNKLIRATGHMKTPAGYVAREKIGIGVMTSYTQPSTNWTPLIAAGDDFQVTFTLIEPRIHYLSTDRNMTPGDLVQIVIADTSGTLTYRRPYTFADEATQALWTILAKDITSGTSEEGSASRYRCYDREPVNPIPGKAMGAWDSLNQNPNTQPGPWCGLTFNGQAQPYIPRTNATSGARWPVGGNMGMYIWPRDNGGEPTDYTVTVSIIRGLALAYDAETTPFLATHTLSYDTQNANFTGIGYDIWGKTSFATARIDLDTDLGTSGTLRLYNVNGKFVDNEPLAMDGSATQCALANGTLTQAVVTGGTSGATGKLCAVVDNGTTGTLYLSEVSGTFQDNEALTCNAGGAATANGTGTVSSTSFYKDNASTLSTSGVLTPIQSKSNGVAWTISFNSAAATHDSPWFNNHQVYQEERRGIPMNGATPHPTLRALFHVTRDNTGAIVGRRATFENSMIYGGAGDHFYHADVSVSGVSQTTGQAKYRMLQHNMWESWSWTQGYTFGCCDPGDFMKARMVPPWYRDNTQSRLHEMSFKTRGGNTIQAIPLSTPLAETFTTGIGTQNWNGYVKSTFNEPLYSGGLDQGPTGGARPEVGAWYVDEWQALAFDTLTNWPALEAHADNVAGAWGFHRIDETRTTNNSEYGMDIHVYSQWDYRDPINTPSKGWVIGRTLDIGENNANYNVSHLWSLRRQMYIQTDHTGRYSGFTAWLLRPEKRYWDLEEKWATKLILELGNSGTTISPPKSGGAANDADHVLGYTTGNGNRGISWVMLESFRARFMQFNGSRRQSYWQRICDDWKNHVDVNVSRNAFGAFHGTYRKTSAASTTVGSGFNSDNWDGPWGDWSAGPGKYITAEEINAAGNEPTGALLTDWIAAGNTTAQWGVYNVMDNFKSCYVMQGMLAGHDWGVIDFTASITAMVWPARSLWAMPSAEWTRGIGIQQLPITSNLRRSSRGVNGSTDGTWQIVADNSMVEFKAFLSSVPRPTSDTYLGIFQFSANYWSLYGIRGEEKYFGASFSPDAYGWAPNYSYESMHMWGVLMGQRYSTCATYVSLCDTYMDLWASTFPPTTSVVPGGTVSRKTGTFHEMLMSTGLIREQDITNW